MEGESALYMNRELQRDVLLQLRAAFPDGMEGSNFLTEADPMDLVRTAVYLKQHGLIDGNITRYADSKWAIKEIFITAAGLDFLAQDGGLTAILGVLTVRLDAETIRGLIDDKLDASPIPEAERSALKTWLQSASAEALKEATKRLVAAALDHAPDALQLLQTLRG